MSHMMFVTDLGYDNVYFFRINVCGATPHSIYQNYIVVVYTHSLDPCLWGDPAFGPPASLSIHLARRSITPAGSVHKSRRDNVLRMLVQLKR